MTEPLLFKPSAAAIARTNTTEAQYEDAWHRSVDDPDGFWREESKRLASAL